jgi:hypothetical protein
MKARIFERISSLASDIFFNRTGEFVEVLTNLYVRFSTFRRKFPAILRSIGVSSSAERTISPSQDRMMASLLSTDSCNVHNELNHGSLVHDLSAVIALSRV